MDLDWKKHPHRRFNPLTGEWVLVSPQRAERPWQGEVETSSAVPGKPWDPDCYLCPRNERAGGARNPDYSSTFVFDNDFPAMVRDTPYTRIDTRGLLAAETEKGVCRVGCFSPRHDLTIPAMEQKAVVEVVNLWRNQYLELGNLPFVNHVQIFENRGQMMGASNPHPHCQIWANATIPDEVAKETSSQLEYHRKKASCLLCDYLKLELDGERIVCANDGFAVLVPFWALWPFETLVIAKRHVTGMDELSGPETEALADILRKITARYDRLFQAPFPYSMGFHQRPVDGKSRRFWHLHAHYFPPLLRSATVRKFMVGYELLASPQRDLAPELAAERLRAA